MLGERISVLDQGWVELIDMMPHPATGVSGDLAIVNAARVSYLGESKGEEADKKLLFYLMRNGHTSCFEMVRFQFRMHAPLVTYWQLARHRTLQFMSVNSQSGRYTEFQEDAYYVPDVWRKQSASNKQGSAGVVEDDGLKITLNQMLRDTYTRGFERYQYALDHGVSKEMARLFLPGFSVYYTWVINVDAHNLMNFLRLRLAPDAQYEIRVYAEAIYEHFFKVLLPQTAEAFELYVLKKGDS